MEFQYVFVKPNSTIKKSDNDVHVTLKIGIKNRGISHFFGVKIRINKYQNRYNFVETKEKTVQFINSYIDRIQQVTNGTIYLTTFDDQDNFECYNFFEIMRNQHNSFSMILGFKPIVTQPIVIAANQTDLYKLIKIFEDIILNVNDLTSFLDPNNNNNLLEYQPNSEPQNFNTIDKPNVSSCQVFMANEVKRLAIIHPNFSRQECFMSAAKAWNRKQIDKNKLTKINNFK